MKKIILIGLFIIVFALGLISGIFYYKKYKVPSLAQQTKACWDQAKQRLATFGLVPNSGNPKQEINNIYGTVESISGNNISLKIKPFDILADPALDNRIISFDSSTKIYQLEKVAGGSQPDMTPPSATSDSGASGSGSADVQQGGDLSKLDSKNMTNPVAPAFSYQSKEIKIGDIKVGDMVSVLSDSNIRDAKNIQAKGITLVPAAAQ
jgi:hypothetical protein